MDGLARSVGNGIGGLVANALATIGSVLHGVVDQANAILPGGSLVLVVGAIVILILGWNVLRRA